MPRLWQVTALFSLLALALVPGLGATHDAALHFEATTGANQNFFLRDGQVAAHLLLRSGLDPRILVAFPAGDSGVGLWFRRSPLPRAMDPRITPSGGQQAGIRPGVHFLGIAFDVAERRPGPDTAAGRAVECSRSAGLPGQRFGAHRSGDSPGGVRPHPG